MTKPSTTSGPLTLVLGGTRSGKSRVAEDLADRDGLPVTYLATAMVQLDDADHQARIAIHRGRRPGTWTTVECPDPSHLVELTRATTGPILIDSLGSWVAGHTDLMVDGPALASALRARRDPTIVVAEEVGWSLHAPTAIGRQFVDALGTVNQEVAAVADRVLLVVAGRILELSAPRHGDAP